MNIIWNMTKLMYATGIALIVYEKIKARIARKPAPVLDSVENQLDISIHTRETEEFQARVGAALLGKENDHD